MLLTVFITGVILPTVYANCTVYAPKMDVLHSYRDERYYYVREGYTFDVYCSSDTNELVIQSLNNKNENQLIQYINSTTIKVRGETARRRRTYMYSCDGANICHSEIIRILVDFYPRTTQFHCSTENLERLNCTWNIPINTGNYTLSYIDQDGTLSPACEGNVKYFRKQYSCLSDMADMDTGNFTRPKISLNMRLCNYFYGCINRMNVVELLPVTKLDTPSLRISNISSHDAVLNWDIQIKKPMKLYYTVEYSFTGLKPRLLTSNTKYIWPLRTSSIQMKLPCPDKLYTVRLSVKPAVAPPEYMSNFGYTSFRTEPYPGVQDLMCQDKPIEETPPVMLYKLRKYVDDELKKYESISKVLKEKLNKYRLAGGDL